MGAALNVIVSLSIIYTFYGYNMLGDDIIYWTRDNHF